MANGLILLRWATTMTCWGPFLPELPCHPLTQSRTGQDYKLSRSLAWVKHLALWLVASLGFWPRISTYIIILWLNPPRSSTSPGCAQNRKTEKQNLGLGKLSKPVFSGGFLQLAIQTCYVLPKLRDRIVPRNLKNQGKRHSGSPSICPLCCWVAHVAAQDTNRCGCPLLTRIKSVVMFCELSGT